MLICECVCECVFSLTPEHVTFWEMVNCVQSKLSVRTVINSPGDRGVKEGMFISYCQLTTMNRNTGAKLRHNVCTCITAYMCVLILLCFWACVRACFQLSVGCQNSLHSVFLVNVNSQHLSAINKNCAYFKLMAYSICVSWQVQNPVFSKSPSV